MKRNPTNPDLALIWEEKENSLESRDEILEAVLLDMDVRWTTRTLPPLTALAAQLGAAVDPSGFCAALAAYATGIVAEATTGGPEALCVPATPWSRSVTSSLVAQAGVDSAVLLPLGSFRLATRLQHLAGGEARSYPLEVLLPALLETASERIESLDLALDASAVQNSARDVVFAPRVRLGRRLAYVVKHGDNLERVAEGVFGDRSLTGRLITTFDLYPPFLQAAPRAGCLSPGMRLLLPVSEQDAPLEGFLGDTLAVTQRLGPSTQNWDLVAAPEGGLLTEGGLEGLAVDAALRLVTPLGSLAGEPRYGTQELIGLLETEGNFAFVSAVETLLEDERIATVLPKTRRVAGGVLVGDVVVLPKSPAAR